MLVAMYSPKGTHNVTFVDNYTNIFVRDALLRVPGVGDIFTRADDSVCAYGCKQTGWRSWVSPRDVVNALTEQNLQIAAGSVGASPQPKGQAFEYTVFTKAA